MRAHRSERDVYAAALFVALGALALLGAAEIGSPILVALAALAGFAALAAFLRGFPIDRRW